MSKYFFVLFFSILAAAIIAPFLAPGHILTLDAFSVPVKMPWTSFWSPSFLFGNFLAGLNVFLPSFWIQKLLLLAIFFLAGWRMANLVPGGTGVKIFAGSLYVVNPFVYERVMAGQWWLLLAYALFPLVLEKMIRFSLIPLVILVTLLANLSTHYFVVAVVLVFSYCIWKRAFRFAAVLAGLALVVNLNWLLALFLGGLGIAPAVNSFNRIDLISFQSLPDPNFGLVFNLLSGYGFWGEAGDFFLSPKSVVFFWPVLSIFIIGLAVYGAFRSLQQKDEKRVPLTICLIVLVFLSLDFAGGVALKPISALVFYLYEKVPFLYGFREPQKMIGLVMLGYAYFGAAGLAAIKKPVFSFLVTGLVFLYTLTVFGGFWGQLRPVSYPQSYFEVKKVLDQDKGDFLVLAFPWHQYLRYRFNNNRPVANLARPFFGSRMLVSRDSHNDTTEALQVSGLLRMETEGVNLLGEKVDFKPDWTTGLAAVNAKYVLLNKDEDFEKYDFLNQIPDLTKVYEGKELILYKLSI